MFKQQSGRSMHINEIKLILSGYEKVGPTNASLHRSIELTGDTHYDHTRILTSDHLIEIYAKPSPQLCLKFN